MPHVHLFSRQTRPSITKPEVGLIRLLLLVLIVNFVLPNHKVYFSFFVNQTCRFILFCGCIVTWQENGFESGLLRGQNRQSMSAMDKTQILKYIDVHIVEQ